MTADDAASGEVPVSAVTVDGQSVSGTLLEIDETSVVLTAERTPRSIPLSDLLELTWDASQPEEIPGAAHLFLTTGDRLAVDVVRLHNDALTCRWREFNEDLEFEISLESVLGMLLQPISGGRTLQSLERELQQRKFQSDVLFLTNGDRLTGVLEGLDRGSCRCETSLGYLEVNRSRVRAVGFNAALLAPVEPTETTLLLHLTDGSWLTSQTVEWNGESELQAVSVTGARVPIPIHKLRSICCYGPRVTPLSDLEPAEVVMTPYLTRETPPRRNRNIHGGPLIVRGESFARGLGMYSRTTATYPVNGFYSTFRAIVGVDDAAGGAGNVTFAVDVDGERIFESGLVTGRDDPLPIGPIHLQHARSITLSVDYGTQGDIGDLADWCNPVLIRSERLKVED